MLARRSLLAACALAALPVRAQNNPRPSRVLPAELPDSATRRRRSDEQLESWLDAPRQRTLPLRVRWPDSDGPWPLLIFSHGLGGSRDGAALWGKAWCEAGFVVIHLQHPGSDSAVWVQGKAALRGAANPAQLIARAADVKFVLDEVARRRAAGEGRWPQVRADAIGMSGHSFGAHTTLAVAGKRYAVAAPWLADARPRAFMAFSPTVTPGAMTPAEQFAAVTRPIMCLTGSLDGDPFDSFQGGETRWRVFEGLPSGAKAGLWLDAADHMSFAGEQRRWLDMGPFGARDVRAVAAEPAHQSLIASLSTLWWRATLMDDQAAAATLRQPSGLGLGGADRWVLG